MNNLLDKEIMDKDINLFIESQLTSENKAKFELLLVDDKHKKFHEHLLTYGIDELYGYSRALLRDRREKEEQNYRFSTSENIGYDNMILHFAAAIDQIQKEFLQKLDKEISSYDNKQNKKRFATLLKEPKHKRFHDILLKMPQNGVHSLAVALAKDHYEGFEKDIVYSPEEILNYENMMLHFVFAEKEISAKCRTK